MCWWAYVCEDTSTREATGSSPTPINTIAPLPPPNLVVRTPAVERHTKIEAERIKCYADGQIDRWGKVKERRSDKWKDNVCARLEEREWERGGPSGGSWENRAVLYGAVTGMDGLTATRCQSGCAGSKWWLSFTVFHKPGAGVPLDFIQKRPRAPCIMSRDKLHVLKKSSSCLRRAILMCVIAVSVWSRLSTPGNVTPTRNHSLITRDG